MKAVERAGGWTGGGKEGLAVIATVDEYGLTLRSRIWMFNCGVGPVDLVVLLGSAGPNRLEHCGLFLISEVAYRDVDASPIGYPAGITPFADLPLLLRLSRLPEATILTGGGRAANSADYEAIKEDIVEMETWAIMRACMRFGRP